jgi:SAM-dependent methyltransferase
MNNKNLKKYLENYTTFFSSRSEDSERFYNTVNKLLSFNKKGLISSDKKVLDVGSGDKAFFNVCLKKKINISEIDGSTGIDFEKDKLPFENESFEIVIFNAVIEHLYNPNLVLSEIFRVLKKGGLLITTAPNYHYGYKYFYDDPTHVHPYTPRSLIKVLQMNNFAENFVYPFLVNKSINYWKIPFKFFVASKIPFRNHTFKKLPIPNFLRGKSTSMISISEKK